MSNFIKLQTQSILQVPISSYENTFTFIVNGKEFHTSEIVADLLSPKISKARKNDPTIREFIINTQTGGDFEQILKLVNFERQEILTNSESFLSEVFDQLGKTAVDIDIYEDELTLDNVIGRLKSHEGKMIYSEHYSNEIDFLSKNFWKAVEEKKSEMITVSKYSLENILNNDKLRISNEDELVSFINEFIENNKERGKGRDENNFMSLYEYVLFENIESSTMKSFIDVFDFNDMNSIIWNSLSSRLVKEVKKCEKEKNERYKTEQTKLNAERSNQSEHIEIPYSNKEFEGIISFLKKNSNIEDEVNITSSSNNSERIFDLHTFIDYENTSKWFCTRNEQNS